MRTFDQHSCLGRHRRSNEDPQPKLVETALCLELGTVRRTADEIPLVSVFAKVIMSASVDTGGAALRRGEREPKIPAVERLPGPGLEETRALRGSTDEKFVNG